MHDSTQAVIAEMEKRLRALQSVVTLERTLRRVLTQQLNVVRSGAPAPSPAQIKPSLPPPQFVVDDDATIVRVPTARVFSPQPVRSADDTTLMVTLPAGFRLFEYRIDAVLGRGGFGVTYLATDVHLNTQVAIKEYFPREIASRTGDRSVSARWPEDRDFYQQGLESFLVEARTLATFRHPNIVRVARFFEAHRTAYIVLEYERGKSLKEWWPKHKGMSEIDLLTLIQALLDGLSMVHASGYLHRDIKPDNIYVRRDDGSLVLLDFGAARQAVGDATSMINAVTPGYAPPEQYAETAQAAATDLYALAASLYWMVSGVKPTPAPERADGRATMPKAQDLCAGRYSPQFLQAIDWALELDPLDRPQTVQVFRAALFGAHAGALGLQEALRADDAEALPATTWRKLLQSPQLLAVRARQFKRKLLHPASWPMAVKMTIAMVMAALLPMTITAYTNLQGTLGAVKTNELQALEQHAYSAAGRISQLLNDSKHVASYLGSDPDFIQFLATPDAANKKIIDDKLASLARSNPDINPVIVMDAQGTALASNDVSVVGKNYAFREYFKEAIAGRAHMTGMVVGANAGAAGVFYSQPVVDAAGTVKGVVVLRILGSSIAAIAGDIRNATLQPFIVDGDGVLIYHRNKSQLYKSLVPLSKPQHQRIVADQRFRRDQIESLNMPDLAKTMIRAQQGGHVTYLSSISGEPEIAGYAPVLANDWVLGVSESTQSFEQPLNRLFSNVLYSVVVTGVIFLLLAVVFARSIVRPVERLTKAADALKQGDYDNATVKVTSGDELGTLARTFNVMIDVLRQRDREQKRKNQGVQQDRGDGEHGSSV